MQHGYDSKEGTLLSECVPLKPHPLIREEEEEEEAVLHVLMYILCTHVEADNFGVVW